MKVAYFDCFAGAGGDMIVASLLDAGCDLSALQNELAKVAVDATVRTEPTRRQGIAGTRFIVEAPQARQEHRNLDAILKIIDAAALSPVVKERARSIFQRLGKAEAKVHRADVASVHFHEVGAIDTIIDVVACCVAIELMGIDRIGCSPIPLGSGTVRCEHGELPVPAPATAELLVGIPTVAGPQSGELTTPTAAAVLTTLAERFGPPEAMRLTATGYGAGSREEGPVPNLLRVLIGEPDEHGQLDSAVELTANLDDCTGQMLATAIERLLAAGCLDAWATPIVMKKSRPAWMLSALCRPGDVEIAERIIFSETTTLGVRRRPCRRSKLQRRFDTIETPYGPVRVKVALDGRGVITASPEYDDCRSAAEAHGVPVKEVISAAVSLWRNENQR